MSEQTYLYPCLDCTTFAARVKELEARLEKAEAQVVLQKSIIHGYTLRVTELEAALAADQGSEDG